MADEQDSDNEQEEGGPNTDLEDDILVVLKLDHHMPSLPVHVPSLGKNVTG